MSVDGPADECLHVSCLPDYYNKMHESGPSKNLLHCNLDIFETVKEASLSCMFPKYKYKVTMCYVLCVMGFDLQEFFQFFDRQVL